MINSLKLGGTFKEVGRSVEQKRIALIGAGKLGKGYLADLFGKAGYELIFMARNQQQVEQMRAQGQYTVVMEHEDGSGIEEFTVSGYQIWCTQGEEREQCLNILTQVPIASVQVYDNGFAAVGKLLGEAIALRAAQENPLPLDILLVVNYPESDRIFAEYIEKELHTEAQKNYFKEKVGLIKTLAFRGGYAAPEEVLKRDPQAIGASDYPELPVDVDAFCGEFPQVEGLIPLDNMDARLKAKLWTGNMRGGMLGAMAGFKGYRFYEQARIDPEIEQFCKYGYEEALYGVLHLFHMTYEDFQKGERKEAVLVPGAKAKASTDTIARQMFGLVRKLGRNERLVGPAMACIQTGKLPYFLARAIAMAFDFENPQDPSAVEVHNYLKEHGIQSAVEKYCGLHMQEEKERILIELICGHYAQLHMKQ